MIRALLLLLPGSAPAATPSEPTPADLHLLDVDGDGDLDVLTLRAGALRLLLQRGGGFEDATSLWGLAEVGPVGEVVPADGDGDGDVDLLLLDGSRPRLLENLGRGFAAGVALGGAGASFEAAAWVDVDADGAPDLHLRGAAGDELLRNLGGLRFDPFEGLAQPRADEVPTRVERPRPAVDGSPKVAGAGVAATTPAGARSAAAAAGLCAATLFDSVLGGCLSASAVPALGSLMPLSVDFNVDPAGNVGIGTTTPGEKLSVAGTVQSTSGGFRFPDGTLQASAASDDWGALFGVPPGFADGVDDDTTYAAATGLSLSNGTFAFDSTWGDARYVEESQGLLGDVTGALGTTTVARLQNRPVSSLAPKVGYALEWTGSVWEPNPDDDTTYAAGAGLALSGTSFSIAPGGVGSDKLASDEGSLSMVSGGALVAKAGKVGVGTVPAHPLDVASAATTPVRSSYSGSLAEAGLRGEAAHANAYGVLGVSSATSSSSNNTGAGVRGQSASPHAAGVHGSSTANGGTAVRANVAGLSDSGATYGVRSENASPDTASGLGLAYGVYGLTNGFSATSNDRTRGLFGFAQSKRARGLYVQVAGSPTTKSSEHAAVYGLTLSTNSYGVYSDGDLGATGVKSFLQPHPTDPSRAIRFVCLEGDEAGTYFRGSGVLVGGAAEIAIPEAWALASEADGITVQVTAVGAPARLWVAEKSRERILVRGDLDAAFDYTVNGVRRGFAGHEALETNGYFRPEVRGVPYGAQFPEALRAILVENGTLNPDYTPNEATAASLGWELLDAGDPRAESSPRRMARSE